MKVCLVMVTFNRFPTLIDSIEAISKLDKQPDYFIIVDNGSTDGTPINLLTNYPEIKLVQLPVNLGYAAGLAAGINYAQSTLSSIDYYWLMDDDSQPQPTALTSLLQLKLSLSLKGILSVTGFVDTIWKGPVAISKFKKKENLRIIPVQPLYSADHVLIDGALIEREVVEKAGVPDGRFFMMCEDVEYSKRIRRAGFRVVVWDNEGLMNRLHQGGGGGFTKSNLWRGYYGARNHLLILKEYFSVLKVLGYAIRQTKYILAALQPPDRFLRIYLRLLGIWHGLLGISGKKIDPSAF